MSEQQYRRSTDDQSQFKPHERAQIRELLKEKEWWEQARGRIKRWAGIVAVLLPVIEGARKLWPLVEQWLRSRGAM